MPHPAASLFLLLLSLSSFPSISLASLGDRDPRYQECISLCSAECPRLASLPANHTFPEPQVLKDGRLYAPAVPLSLACRLLFWSCEDNCKYDCMHLHVEWSASQGWNTLKYYGKWPFVRVLGLQELLSVLFSVGNLLPHAYYAVQYRRRVNRRYSMRNWWTAYALVSCNTWLWSAVFHARDVLLTERLDYFSASLGIMISFTLQIIRSLHIQSFLSRVLVLAVSLSLTLYHISYLHFIHFDYGYNMLASLITGALYSIFTCTIALLEQRPYYRTIVLSHLYLWCVAAFEVLDFAPIGGLLDAHAIWHGATMWIGVVFWEVMIEDARWEGERERVGSGPKHDSSSMQQNESLLEEIPLSPIHANGKKE